MDLLLATDPDCDRVGIAVRDGDDFILMSGNEVGAMLCEYLLSNLKEQNKLPENPIVVKSIVTTPLIEAICSSYGAEVADLLTGFKYIGELITNLEKEGKEDNFVVGMEESYGYLRGIHARDKDAVVASLMIAEMAAVYKLKGISLKQFMDSIYEKYGMYLNTVLNFAFEGASGMQKMSEIMTFLRENTPKSFADKKVVKVADYKTSKITDKIANEETTLQEIIKPEIEKMAEDGFQITEFEALTATAFLCFSKLNVDVVVLEVGLGGRLDATNVITTPLVNIITSLSLDHTAILGDTLEKIAFEKCGTLKENGTLVCSYNQPKEALEVIKNSCNEKNNCLILPDSDDVAIKEESILGTQFTYKGELYFTAMPGAHQVQNMVSVIEAVNALRNKGYNISVENLKKGIEKTVLPARVEVINKNPLVILDGGHNEDGARAFYKTVEKCLKNKKRLFVVGGMMNDKAVEDSLKPLLLKTDVFVAVTPQNPRAMKAEALADIAKKYCENVFDFDNATDAMDFVKEKIIPEDFFFVVGSLYLAGEVREKLLEDFAVLTE